jgi:hypothetical protein
LNKDL